MCLSNYVMCVVVLPFGNKLRICSGLTTELLTARCGLSEVQGLRKTNRTLWCNVRSPLGDKALTSRLPKTTLLFRDLIRCSNVCLAADPLSLDLFISDSALLG